MGKVKAWMMDMEDMVVDGIRSGARTEDAVVSYVKTNMSLVDESFVRKFYEEINGEPFFPVEEDNWLDREGPKPVDF